MTVVIGYLRVNTEIGHAKIFSLQRSNNDTKSAWS